MFIKSSLIILAMTLSASATPLMNGLGTSIPFQNRNELATSQGYFDHSKAVKQVVRDRNKHRRNLLNLKRNMGSDALPEGAHIIPIANYSQAALSLSSMPEKRQSESLTNQANDQFWTGPITIGSNKQSFAIDFDTGSADLWVPSINCTSSVCKSRNRYNAAKSTTSARKSGTFTILYGDGSSVSGPVYTDTVSVAGIRATGQYFSPVTTMSSMFAGEALDGILGLAFPALSNLQQSPFVNTAKAQGALPAATFGFKLAKTGSELYLGGANSKLYTGSIETHPVTSRGFWQIGNAKVQVGSTTAVNNIQTIIDSGTTIIYGPPSQVKALYASIPGSKVYDSKNGFYTYPCASPPSVAFAWGTGKSWAISAANFNLGQVDAKNCVGAIAGQDLGLGASTWLLGDSFMKNVYSVFSFEQNTVGFAQLK